MFASVREQRFCQRLVQHPVEEERHGNADQRADADVVEKRGLREEAATSL